MVESRGVVVWGADLSRRPMPSGSIHGVRLQAMLEKRMHKLRVRGPGFGQGSTHASVRGPWWAILW